MRSGAFGLGLFVVLMICLYYFTLGPGHEVMNEYCKAKHITSCDGIPNNHWQRTK